MSSFLVFRFFATTGGDCPARFFPGPRAPPAQYVLYFCREGGAGEAGLRALLDLVDRFAICGDLESAASHGSGLISGTFVSGWNQAGYEVYWALIFSP
jgi:hypothetical protein